MHALIRTLLEKPEALTILRQYAKNKL